MYPIATIGSLDDGAASARPCCAPCARGIGDLQPESEALRLVSGGLLPTIVWPSDVEAYKRKVDPDMIATNATVAQCAALGSGAAKAWRDFFSAWRTFRAQSTPLFGAANQFDEARAYEARLSEWQSQLQGAGCTLHAPKVEPVAAADLSALKWVAVAVALVAVAYLASPLVLGARKVAR